MGPILCLKHGQSITSTYHLRLRMKFTLVRLISLALMAIISVEALAQSQKEERMTSEVLKTGTDTIAEQAEVPIMRSGCRCGRNEKCVCGFSCFPKHAVCTTQGRQTSCRTRTGQSQCQSG